MVKTLYLIWTINNKKSNQNRPHTLKEHVRVLDHNEGFIYIVHIKVCSLANSSRTTIYVRCAQK